MAVTVVILALLGAGCGGGDTTPTPKAAASPEVSGLDGSWELVGYGYVVTVVDGEVVDTLLPIGEWCLPGEFAPVERFDSTGTGTAQMEIEGSITVFHLQQVPLPAACDTPALTAEPVEVVEAFIAVMDARYPFFEARGVDWEAEQAALRTAVADATTVDDAAAIIGDLIWRIGDTHNGIDSDAPPSVEYVEFTEALDAELELARIDADGRLGDTLVAIDSGVLVWGELEPGIGYLRIERLAAVAGGLEVDDTEDLADLQAGLDAAFTALDDADHLVVDLRFNGGGSDALALETVSRFVDGPVDLFTKEAHEAPAQTRTTASVSPSTAPGFDGDVTLLVSPATASAAEILGVSLREAVDARVVGSPTEGIFSDSIPWLLPGGVEMVMSMEVYRDLDGQSLELRGVPVDVQASPAEALSIALEDIASRAAG